MTATQLDIPATEGIRSLEVRWIFPGQLETAVAGWFARFPAELETREDFGSPSHGGRDPAGLEADKKNAAHQPVFAGQRPNPGAWPEAG